MAAPAGVSSGSAPEPETPEPAATEPLALEAAVPEQSGPAPGESTVAVPEADREPTGPEADRSRCGRRRIASRPAANPP